MALPKINEFPTYELEIPSTKQTVRYRPFLVKEQKVLLMALEAQDENQIMNAMLDTIRSCVLDQVNINVLTSFDVEYIFIKIRSKSVGETSTLALKCAQCEHQNEVTIALDDIKVDMKDVDNKIKINDQYTIQMRWPKYNALMATNPEGIETMTEMLYRSIRVSLDKLLTEEEVISFDNETEEEINSFIENLSTEQFDRVVKFIEQVPALTHKIDYTCEQCNHENHIMLKGAQDFF